MDSSDIIIEWNREHAGRDRSLFVDRLLSKGLTKEQVVDVLEAVEHTCMYCWDGDWNCDCWNSE